MATHDDLARKTHSMFSGEDKERRATTLFKAADFDGSGQIDKAEFGKLYDVIKIEVEQELAKEQALKDKVRKGKRNLWVAIIIGIILLTFLGVSVAANFAVAYAAADAMKDSAIMKEDATHAIRTRDGQMATVGQAQMAVDLPKLPNTVDGKIPTFIYNKMDMINFKDKHGALLGFRVNNYKWYAEDFMILEQAWDNHVVIHNNQILHIRPDGKVKFTAGGSPVTINATASDVTSVTAKCNALSCPLSDCSAHVLNHNLMGIHTLTCDGLEMYKYTDDIGTSAGRRKLFAPAVVVTAAIVHAPAVMSAAGGLAAGATGAGVAGGAGWAAVGVVVGLMAL